ncbi:MAG: hypothetical protein IJJ14_03215 [Coriobacteriales bacterium]|nr:hypothetical protein [Coriobacteriales bacterium]
MLGKLLKYEFKSTGLFFLIAYAVTFMTAVAVRISYVILSRFPNTYSTEIPLFGLGGYYTNSEGQEVVLTLAQAFNYATSQAFISLIGILPTVLLVILLYRFYRSMYSTEGYLTHTLPVGSSTILASKAIAAIIWMFATAFVVVVSLAVVFWGVVSFDDLSRFFRELVDVYFDMDAAGRACLWALMVGAFFAPFFRLFLCYASFALGQLFNKHRVLAAILIYAGIYMLGSFLLILGGSFCIAWLATVASDEWMLVGIVWAIVALEVICTVGFYVVTDRITNKPLNLE